MSLALSDELYQHHHTFQDSGASQRHRAAFRSREGEKLFADLRAGGSQQCCISHSSISEELKHIWLFKAYQTLKGSGVRVKRLLPSWYEEITTVHSSA